MDAIITAGGNPRPGDLLYPYTKGKPKALLDIAGQSMIQWVLDAVGSVERIDQVVIVGIDAMSGVSCQEPKSIDRVRDVTIIRYTSAYE